MAGLFPRAENHFRSEGLEERRLCLHKAQRVGEQLVRFYLDVVRTSLSEVGIDVCFHFGQGKLFQFFVKVAESITLCFSALLVGGSYLYQSVEVLKTMVCAVDVSGTIQADTET